MCIRECIFLNQNLYLFKLILFCSLINKFHLIFLNKMNLQYPLSLTLYNDNILLITDQKILFLDSSLNNIITNYTLEEYQKLNSTLSEKALACQYPIEYEGYIITFINDYLFLFNKEGDKLFEKNLTEQFNEIPYYDLLPILKANNYLYYVISYTSSKIENQVTSSQIKIFYNRINIDNGDINLEKEKTFNKTGCKISKNISCQIMNSANKSIILTCFFSCFYPTKIYSISLDIENELNELDEYSTEKDIDQVSYTIDFIKAISVGNKTSALVAFYQKDSTAYTSVYNINTNTFSKEGKRGGYVGGLLAHLNLVYFTRTEQYVLSFRDNNQQFYITIMDKNYNVLENKEGKINYRYPSGWFGNKRESVIYIIENNSYSFISDIASFEGYFLKIVPIGFYANLTYKEETIDFKNTDSLENEKDTDKITNEKENDIKENKDTTIYESNTITNTNFLSDEKKDIKTDIKEDKDTIKYESDTIKNEVEKTDVKSDIKEDKDTTKYETNNNTNIIEDEKKDIVTNIKEDKDTTKYQSDTIKDEDKMRETDKIETRETDKSDMKENEYENNTETEINEEQNETNNKENVEKEIETQNTHKEEDIINTNKITESYIDNNNKDEDIEVIEVESDIIDSRQKCSSYNTISKKLNLCIKCNGNYGYYPVCFNPNDDKSCLTKYKECFNEDTKLINYYFNKEKRRYEPCYETCNTCNYRGNEEINNCTSCDYNGIFRPETNGTTNCVKKCKYKYYFTSYGQYKCTETEQCPSEANLLIKEKNKCIENCILDDKYKFQYDGKCVAKCPNETTNINNICVQNDKNKCTYRENEFQLTDYLKSDNLDILAKTYAKEFNYTNNHISLFFHESYSIFLYKNEKCINELSLNAPQIDFGSCYQTIASKYNLNSNLVILIIQQIINGFPLILYSFYNPYTGARISAADECKNDEIVVNENIISILKSTEINIDNFLKLAQQNIDIFSLSSEFFTDICFHYESPNGKDITLKDRIKEYFPNITLCNEGCLYDGINITSMSAICKCKFSDIVNGDVFAGNAFFSNAIQDISQIFYKSNLFILKCYRDIFDYRYFSKNTCGFIVITLIICQTLSAVIYYNFSYKIVNKYLFMIVEIYISYLNKKDLYENKTCITRFMNDNGAPPKKKKNKKSSKNIIYRNNINVIKFIINKEKEDSVNSDNFNSQSKLKTPKTTFIKPKGIFKRTKIKKFEKFIKNHKVKIKNEKKFQKIEKIGKKIKKSENYKINDFISNYLSTEINDMEYDFAIKEENRNCFVYFWERLKEGHLIFDILLGKETIKPRIIKISLLLVDIDLYFLINGLFINEDYLSTVYHSTEKETFFSFIGRGRYNFFYATMVGFIINILISFFFLEEKKIKNLFKREKDNKLNIKYGIIVIFQKIQNSYKWFFISNYIICIFSWYYLSCFNNVYPYIRKEWIKSSFFIFIMMQIFSIIFIIIETILRYLSFKMKSERIFKLSRIFI